MKKYHKYLYIDQENNNCPLLISAQKQPSLETMPRSGTWVVREWHEDNWCIPCFPEITWERIKKLTFIMKLRSKE